MERKRITIEDVARAAGVSRQTVSRAINSRGEISAETRARVLRIAEEMGYRPSSIARGLATRRTRTLGLVVPDNTNPFFADVARGVEHVAYAEGYSVFLCNTDEDPQREWAVLQSLEERQVDGVVLCSSRLEDEALREVVACHPVVVLVNRRPADGMPAAGQGMSAVLVDDEAGGQMVTEHLLRAGRRETGFLAGPPTSRSGRQRVEGYCAALAAAGLSPEPDRMPPCSPTVDGGQAAAHELLAAHANLNALVCYNDLVAVGALQACAELGRRVPEDVAVVGFDDIPLAALVTPALTTCCVPRYELGVQAMQALLLLIDGGEDAQREPGVKEIVLRPELIVRASTP